MFSNGLEIFSAFNIHHPVYGPLLLTIALAPPVCSADKGHLCSGEISKLIFKKTV